MMENRLVPGFFVFEGIDGCGKSTQSRLLHFYIESLGRQSRLMSEPTPGKYGSEIRSRLKGSGLFSPEEQLNLFLLDREEDSAINIIPALEARCSVVMDRYYFSNIAYQGAAGLDPELILRENRKRKFPEPDRIYYIDISPETAIERIKGRGGVSEDIFEKKDFLTKVRDIYLSLKDERFIVLDGSHDESSVFERIKSDYDKNFL